MCISFDEKRFLQKSLNIANIQQKCTLDVVFISKHALTRQKYGLV
jgi:hypothetical protein